MVFFSARKSCQISEQSRIQKLLWIQKLGFRNSFVGFRNSVVGFRNFCVGFKNFFAGFRNSVFRNFFVGFRNSVRRIQKLFSSDSETFFLGFRIFVRRIQKLFSSDSETFFVGFRNSFRRIQKLFSIHAFNDYYIPFIKNFPPFPLATQPMLSMITTFLSSKFDPPPLATHAFNDSGSSITFLLSRFLHSFYQDFPLPPLATQPMLSMITTFLLSKFDPTPWQPMLSMIQVQVLHFFYQDFYISFINISPSPLATQPMLSMITTFLLSKFLPPPWQPMLSMIQVQILHSFIKIFTFILSTFPVAPLGNPTHAFNDYYIPSIKISPSLATQPVLPVIITFLLSKFDPPPLATHAFNDSGSSITFLLSRFLHSFYQDFPLPPLATQPMLSMITTFILSKFPPPLGNPTHALNDSCSSTTFLSSRFLHSFYQDFPPPPLATQPMLSMITTFLLSKFLPPPWQPNPCIQ